MQYHNYSIELILKRVRLKRQFEKQTRSVKRTWQKNSLWGFQSEPVRLEKTIFP